MSRAARIVGPVIALTLLAACVETVETVAPPPAAIEPPSGEDTCGLAPARALLGLDNSVIAVLQRSSPVRVIGPDQPVTMDYNPDRLNVFTDAQGRIERVTCG